MSSVASRLSSLSDDHPWQLSEGHVAQEPTAAHNAAVAAVIVAADAEDVKGHQTKWVNLPVIEQK